MALERDEMIEILEDLARNGGDSAKIQAIRTLMALGERSEGADDQFAALDGDDLAKQRQKRVAAR